MNCMPTTKENYHCDEPQHRYGREVHEYNEDGRRYRDIRTAIRPEFGQVINWQLISEKRSEDGAWERTYIPHPISGYLP